VLLQSGFESLHGHILSLTDSKKGTGTLAVHVKGSCFRLRSLDSRGKSCTGRFHRARARAKTTPAMTNDDDSVIGGMHGAGGPRCRHAEHRAHVVGTTSCRRCMRGGGGRKNKQDQDPFDLFATREALLQFITPRARC
jgi:hypothetical protein